ncbi:MAG: ribonuclease HI [Tissierellia bacterium]|jgi:ribonuclease HI|nr:ribonuclease HI [Tissierellia bacterium]MDD3227170.1 ribonuclease HI [Tissierellia bacterium]MDD3751256.1 ribonuclease HI [Tissierellia bacterium]MDD4045640.1 ribonuclease HI [Tissierellia bacterium]MDD4678282.1 ribonuclease HI [Tissierellia bacterium]
MKKVNIYSDGACSKNPGPGGYGVILEYKGHEVELSGGEENTTNNQMELLGVIKGLEALKEPCDVTIVTDSKYVTDSFNKGWIDSWQKKGWKKSDGKAVLNKELWQRLLKAKEAHKVKFVHVPGHKGHSYNERCDKLAVEERKKFEIK